MWRLIGLSMVLATPARAQTVGYDKVVAVLIGISDYTGRHARLPNAVTDVENVEASLRALFDGQRLKIIKRTNAQATRRGIFDAYSAGIEAAKGDRGLLFVYYSGHGSGRYGEDGYLVPHGARHEADNIAMARLRDKANKGNGVRHQIFVFGACFGGRIFRTDSPDAALADSRSAAIWLEPALKEVGRAAITAGGPDEKVPDGPPGQGSLFGNALADALRPVAGQPKADVNADGCVSVSELGDFVARYGSRQNTPRASTLDGFTPVKMGLCARPLQRIEVAAGEGTSRGGAPGVAAHTTTGGGRLGFALLSGVTALTSAGLAVWTGLEASDKHSRAAQYSKATTPAECGGRSAEICAEKVRDLVEERDRFVILTWALGGLAAVSTGVGLWLWLDDDEAPRATPLIGPDFTGFGLSGHF